MQGRRIVGRSRICLVPPAHCQTCGIKARSGKRAGEAYFSHGNLGTRRLDALHLVAKGTGGTQDATARVTVNAAPAPPPETSNATEEELFAQNVKDVYFEYDKYDIRGADQRVIQGDASFLQQHPNIRITVEGHCDERGSTEYNLALGANRADAVKNALIQAGLAGDRVKTISYGKEKPFCSESNESCWQQNRRGHFVYEK